MQAIKNADNFYNWRAFWNFNNASVAYVAFAPRTPQLGPAVIAGFDIDDRAWQYDFLSTLWSQGGCGWHQKTTQLRTANNVYNFKFWQYIDISYYFGHALLTVPPTMWTNAAHKNGVFSLGTLNLNNIDPTTILDAKHLHQTILALTDIAATLKFDGYLINFEKRDLQFVQPILTLMKSLSAKGLKIIWYDSPLSDGFANYLNEEAIPFLNTAGYFQSNYKWGYPYSSGFPEKSLQTLEKYHLAILNNHIFQTGDAYRDSFKINPQDICIPSDVNNHFTRFKDIFKNDKQTSYFTALGFFAPNWTMFGGNADPMTDTNVPDITAFEQSDAAYWEGSGMLGCGHTDFRNVSYFVKPRTVITSMPFYTNFNTGVGDRYYINGKVVSTGPWSHFTLQNILPTWQNVTIGNSRPKARAFFDYQDAYAGGSSWKIEDNTILQAPVTFKLFQTNLLASKNDEIDLVVKTSANEDIQLVVNQTQLLSASQKINLENGWRNFIYKLPTAMIVNEIDVAVIPAATGKININLGSLKIFKPGFLPIPQNQFATFVGSRLYWLPKNPGSSYRVYGKDQKGTYTLLNEVVNIMYDTHGNIFNGNVDFSQFISFLIQEVTTAGDFITQ